MVELTLKPIFSIIRANFFEANKASLSFLAPVQTILPDLNIKAVVLGSRIRIIKPLNLAGLYSELRVREFILVNSNSVFKSTVATQFLKNKTKINGIM